MKGRALKTWRKGLGLSQRQLGDLLGVTKTAVCSYEHGLTPCKSVEIIMDALRTGKLPITVDGNNTKR